jgi:hypothetical protein
VTTPNDKRSLPFGGSFAITDQEFPSSTDGFCQAYLAWIKTTQENVIRGLDNFPILAYSNGTTEAFDKFYMKNNTRRFRCYKGEYMYHQATWRNCWPNWKFIEDASLDPNDAVVISLPFSNTGNEHPSTQQLLTFCSDLGIPVLVDCAYFGVCSQIMFDFDYDCITDITFSMSKAFPVAYHRIGMRLTRIDDDDPLLVSNKIGYTNRYSAELGKQLLTMQTPDHMVELYRGKQEEFCKHLGIQPSKTVLFGLDTENKYPEYNRGAPVNRLSLHKYLDQDKNIFYNENSPR